MDGTLDTNIFSELDKMPVPEGWLPGLSRALLRIEQAIVPIDRPILAPFVSYVAGHLRFLRKQASVESAAVEAPDQITKSHPVSSTLFLYTAERSAGLERLTCIGLCALMVAGTPDRRKAERLLSTIRGALESPHSELALALGSATSLPALVGLIDQESALGTLPSHFVSQWTSWLRDTVLGWMLREPCLLRHSLEAKELTPSLEALEVPVSLANAEPENAVTLSCFNSSTSDFVANYPATIRAGRAASEFLERASQGDLLSPPDFRIPRELDERLCQRTVSQAEKLIIDSPTEAESFVALAVALSGGVREIDLKGIVWGDQERAKPHSIDPCLPVLYKRIKRPAGAVNPPQVLSDWLESSVDVIAWPLPGSVYGLLRGLVRGSDLIPGDPVFPSLAQSAHVSYRLMDLIGLVVPEANVGALAPRLGLASEIARAFGTEVAQLAFADTFSMPPVPAYYSAMPVHELVELIARIQSRRFGETVRLPPKQPGFLGSRLVLTDPAARRWSERLRFAIRSVEAGPTDLVSHWVAHRDSLVAALCSATGHRPENALSQIFLGDVIPEYGLVILQDKQVDALRTTRIAATGRLWMLDLRRYLDRLIELSETMKGEPAADLAALILRSEKPLFTALAPSGAVSEMTAESLRNTMPPELRVVDNFYRHRLNQCLQKMGVDPELRHAQLGWVVSPAHFVADLSPRAPVSLGIELGPVIDDLLIADGWYVPSARRKTRWTWDGVPMPAPVDWKKRFFDSNKQHQDKLKAIRQQLHDRWKECEVPVMKRLASAVAEFCPLLRLDPETKRLKLVPGIALGVELNHAHYELICDRTRLGDEDPSSALEAVTARFVLYRLIRHAKASGLVKGPDPSRPHLSITSIPSPFLPGLGQAVRQAQAMRHDLQARGRQGRKRDLGPMTVWSILAFSMYRRIPWAQAAVNAARNGMRSSGRGHLIRIPAIVEHAERPMVFGGLPAILLSRRKRDAPTAHAPTEAALEEWAIAHLSSLVDWGKPNDALGCLEGTLFAAAHIELSGIERGLLNFDDRTAAETSARCIECDDKWPVRTAAVGLDLAPSEDLRRQPSISKPSTPAGNLDLQRSAYRQYIGLLNKRKFGQSRAARKSTSKAKPTDGKQGWRSALKTALSKLREEVEGDVNLVILISYSLDHLHFGSEDGHKLGHDSMQREVSQIGWPLLSLLSDRNILCLSAEELRKLYFEVLLSKSDLSRPYAFEELQRFHRYLSRAHACPAVDMKELEALAGPRRKSVAPGLLTSAELAAVSEALDSDYIGEKERPDVSPDFLRLALLRKVMFLILEASGIRPGSAYGLTLSDIHLIGASGDFVHVRTAGEYGEAKTATSIGFVPLESELWRTNRGWLRGWLEDQRTASAVEDWTKIPLFAQSLGSRTRFHDAHLTRRVDELLKWACRNSKASCYWLRKVCVTQRYQALHQLPDVSAQDVRGVLTISGHVWIQTAIEGYVNDPASLLVAEIRNASRTSRAAMLGMSGLAAGPLDMAWNRSIGNEFSRISILLDRLGQTPLRAPDEVKTTPPLLRRFKPFLPLHVDTFARAMSRCKDRSEAIIKSGITDDQAGCLDAAAEELMMRRGYAPWRLVNQTSTRSTMEVPRALAGTEQLFASLGYKPSQELIALATAWMEQAHVARLYDQEVFLVLKSSDELKAVDDLVDKGLAMQVRTIEGCNLLKETKQSGNDQGHSAALRWILSVVWIFSKVTAAVPAY